MNFQTMNKQRLYMLIAATAGMIAVFLPWFSISAGAFGMSISRSINGFHGWGIVCFFAFATAAVVALIGDQTTALNKMMWLAAMAAGAVSLLIVIIAFATAADTGGGMGYVDAGPSFGIWTALAASVGIVAFAWLYKDPAHTLTESFSGIKTSLKIPVSSATAGSAKTPVVADKIAEIERLSKLKENGAITEEEYQQLKAKVL